MLSEFVTAESSPYLAASSVSEELAMLVIKPQLVGQKVVVLKSRAVLKKK